MRRGTWRTESGTWFAAIVLGALIAEISAATLLTWSFAGQALGTSLVLPVESLVIGAITTGAMALLALTVYLLGFHVFGERRRRRHETELEGWTGRWVAVLFQQADLPQGALSRPAQDALAGLCESMQGAEGRRLRELIAMYGIDVRLMRDIASKDPRKRLSALEGLAVARLPQCLDLLIDRMLDPRPEIRTLAARAAARTIGSLSAGPSRDAAGARFGQALILAGTARGVFEEMLLLTDHAGESIERDLLRDPALSGKLVAAVIDAASRSDVATMLDLVQDYSRSPDPETRAAVLRFLGRMQIVPVTATTIVLDGIHDEFEFVRVNAVRAARKLPPDEVVHELWARLGDRSWWVRKGAAESLAAMGTSGEAMLSQAAQTHPDRFGRDMAAQVIVDAGLTRLEEVAA